MSVNGPQSGKSIAGSLSEKNIKRGRKRWADFRNRGATRLREGNRFWNGKVTLREVPQNVNNVNLRRGCHKLTTLMHRGTEIIESLLTERKTHLITRRWGATSFL